MATEEQHGDYHDGIGTTAKEEEFFTVQHGYSGSATGAVQFFDNICGRSHIRVRAREMKGNTNFSARFIAMERGMRRRELIFWTYT